MGRRATRGQTLISGFVAAGGGFILGAIAGSFIATWTQRWGAGLPISGRSRCDGCARILSPLDLIPLLSFVVLRGRCRTCGVAIGARQCGIEATAALIGAASLFMSPDLNGLSGAWFGWLLLALLIFDAEQLWLPDIATGLLALSGLALGLGDWQDRAIGLIAGFAALELIRQAYRLIRHREGMGGGDPKLFAAIGAWLGWSVLPFVALGASLTGIALITVRMMRGQPVSADMRLPFGGLLAAVAFPISLWLVISQISG